MTNSDAHKRAHWKKEVVLDRTDLQSPLIKFAAYARDKSDAATRKALCSGSFGAALDELLKTVSSNEVVDLTAEERAFCEGWALLARRQCYDSAKGEIDDAKLQAWIDDQLKQPPWIEIMTG